MTPPDVGGAPRDEIAERTRLDPDRVRDVLDARDDQNDDVQALPDGRGFTDEDVERGAWALAALRAAVRDEREIPPGKDDYRNARAVLRAVEPGALSAASTKPSSSGAAPKGDEWRAGYQAGRMETLEVVQNSRIGFPARKGEQEEVDESSASWQNGYEVGFEHAKVASPPPDRLTPEERDFLDWHKRLKAVGHPIPLALTAIADRLLARLADREPE